MIGVTAHRPKKLVPTRVDPYSPKVLERLTNLFGAALEKHRNEEGISAISGMAQGGDQAFCLACLLNGIPYTAAVPFAGQEKRWKSLESQALYRQLLEKAHSTVYVTTGVRTDEEVSQAMKYRNTYMVNEVAAAGGFFIGLWDGSPSGTGHCVGEIERAGLKFVNYWPSWVKRSGFFGTQR